MIKENFDILLGSADIGPGTLKILQSFDDFWFWFGLAGPIFFSMVPKCLPDHSDLFKKKNLKIRPFLAEIFT